MISSIRTVDKGQWSRAFGAAQLLSPNDASTTRRLQARDVVPRLLLRPNHSSIVSRIGGRHHHKHDRPRARPAMGCCLASLERRPTSATSPESLRTPTRVCSRGSNGPTAGATIPPDRTRRPSKHWSTTRLGRLGHQRQPGQAGRARAAIRDRGCRNPLVHELRPGFEDLSPAVLDRCGITSSTFRAKYLHIDIRASFGVPRRLHREGGWRDVGIGVECGGDRHHRFSEGNRGGRYRPPAPLEGRCRLVFRGRGSGILPVAFSRSRCSQSVPSAQPKEVRAMLEMRSECEHCKAATPPESANVLICSYECTFCAACAGQFERVCPNLRSQPSLIGPPVPRLDPLRRTAHDRALIGVFGVQPRDSAGETLSAPSEVHPLR